MTKKLIIIDLSNFIFRAFFAIQRPMHASDGTPTNAVHGVLSMFQKMLSDFKPTHVLIARDTKEGSFRKQIYEDYKANRSEPPPELVPQFGIIDEMFKTFGVATVTVSNYEADDVIGSVAVQWKKYFDEILIASGDKDLMQFVDGPVHILDTMKEKVYAREDVKDKMGVYPEQIVDFLSLIGDTSDNIPGVPGIGPKGAQGLIEEFGSLENILANVDKISNKRAQTALAANKDKAILSKELVKIVTDLEFKFHPEETSYKLALTPTVEEFLMKYNLTSMLNKLAPLRAKEVGSASAAEKPKHPVKSICDWTLDELKAEIKGEKYIAINQVCDDELDQRKCWKGIAITTSKASGYIAFDKHDVTALIKILNEANALVVCYQSKPLLQLAMMYDGETKFEYFDLAQAHFLINPDFRHDLNTLAEEFLQQRLSPPKKGQTDLFGGMDDFELNLVGERSEAIYRLYPILEKKMEEQKVERPYHDLDIPLIKVLAAMELEGVRLNVPFYKELENEFSGQISGIESDIFKLAGDKINLRSPKQIGEFLFEKLQLPVIKKTKTGYSTDADVLTELAAMNVSPVPELLLRYREVEKLLGTYVKALPLLVNAETAKIHTHFQPNNAATGRLSSDNPNLQNIPIRTESGRKLRKGFVPSPGHVLLSADYSQVELRLLAHFSQDPSMLEAFRNDLDIHKQTAAEVFDIPLEKVTKEQRNAAKGINFGLMYGQTSFGLSQALKISQGEAKTYITNYFRKFSRVKSYLDGLKEKAEQTGYAETLFGRKRILPDINASNRAVKALAERMAINSPIQGTAADIIKLAMINIQKALKDRNLKSRMILQVHDELIFDVVPEELKTMEELVRDKMENAVNLSVPLKVEMGSGDNWYDLK